MKLVSKCFSTFLFLLLFSFPSISFAQDIPGEDFCTQVSPSTSLPASVLPCIDEAEIFDQCEKNIYLRVNFHFFMNDGCGNDVYPHTTTTAQAFTMAETLLNDANARLASNQD